MLEPIVAFFEKLISDFSWRRLTFVVTFIGFTLTGLWGYESYTGSFQLARIEKELSLLERLSKLANEETVREHPELGHLYEGLHAELGQLVNRPNPMYTVSPTVKKAIAATVPWLALALLIFFAGKGQAGSFTNATASGMAIVAIPCIIIGASLPDFDATWINYWAYPLGHIVIVLLVIMVLQRRRSVTT